LSEDDKLTTLRVRVELCQTIIFGFAPAGGRRIRLDDVGGDGSQHFSGAQAVKLNPVFVGDESLAVADGADVGLETELVSVDNFLRFRVVENDTRLGRLQMVFVKLCIFVADASAKKGGNVLSPTVIWNLLIQL